MKKMSILGVLASGALLLCSCLQSAAGPEQEEEEPTLAGTTWKSRFEDAGDWMEEKLVFTATHATYSETYSSGSTMNFTGTYTYDPPTVVITSNSWNFSPPSSVMKAEGDIRHEGTVEGQTMTIGIQTIDMVGIIELKKQ
jgi:hypothetical protein